MGPLFVGGLFHNVVVMGVYGFRIRGFAVAELNFSYLNRDMWEFPKAGALM